MPLAGKRLLIVSADEGLARVLTAAAARLGASIVRCHGGRAALEEIEAAGAHAAVLDLPPSDFRPDALLLALRNRGVKVVAVSGTIRAERYAATAVRFGAERFLEKPFDAQEALEALERALAGASSTATSTPTTLPRPMPSPTLLPDLTPLPALTPLPSLPPEPSSELPLLEPEPTADFPLADDLDSYIFSEAEPALDGTLPGIPLAPRPHEGLAAPLPATSVPAARRPALPSFPEGDLAATSVPRVLAALHAARATGALTLARAPAKKLVLLEDGRPVFAASNLPSERFGARCVREGLLTAEALAALTAAIGPKEPLNEALLARGLLSPEQRTRMFSAHIQEILWSTFGWRDGSYRLLHGPRARRPIVRTDLTTAHVVLDGFRRALPLERLRELLPAALALAAATPIDLRELPMSEAEARMLAHADGTKTAADLVLLSGLEERSALAFLAGCVALGVLDEVSRSLAGTGRIGFM